MDGQLGHNNRENLSTPKLVQLLEKYKIKKNSVVQDIF